MSTPQSTTAFAESVRLLLELHRLYEGGNEESPEADVIRDAMDSPWYEMTEDEQRRIRQLSADLYTIGERHLDPPPPAAVTASFERARAGADWMGLLSLLQEHPGLADPKQRSYLRSTAWAALSAPMAAVLFLADASRMASPRGSPPSLSSASRPVTGAPHRFPRYHYAEAM